MLNRKINKKGTYMRTEEITAKALEQVNFDKYLLSIAVG
mgnify:FL=1